MIDVHVHYIHEHVRQIQTPKGNQCFMFMI